MQSIQTFNMEHFVKIVNSFFPQLFLQNTPSLTFERVLNTLFALLYKLLLCCNFHSKYLYHCFIYFTLFTINVSYKILQDRFSLLKTTSLYQALAVSITVLSLFCVFNPLQSQKFIIKTLMGLVYQMIIAGRYITACIEYIRF